MRASLQDADKQALKRNCSYKIMRYMDLTESERIQFTRGWTVDDVGCMQSQVVTSGEIDTDVGDELVEILRGRNVGSTLVWMDRAGTSKVRVTFRGRNDITRLLAGKIEANRELAILQETDYFKLVNTESTGVLQMLAGLRANCSVKAYGSWLNSKARKDEDGQELTIEMMHGLFAICEKCNSVVCTINGLVAEISFLTNVYYVERRAKHDCVGPVYRNYPVQNRLRVAVIDFPSIQ